jgi:oligosaccharyltransferase complex subunit gamma
VEGVNRYMPSPIPYTQPMNWAPVIGGVTFLLVTALAAPFVLPLLQNKWVWAMISVGTSLIMTSGLMFVRIRGNPYVAVGRDGKAEWIASGFQNQFGMETHVVAFICRCISFAIILHLIVTQDGMLSLSCLVLVVFAPRLTSAWKQKTVIFLWSGIATVVYAVLLSFFRLKNPGTYFQHSLGFDSKYRSQDTLTVSSCNHQDNTDECGRIDLGHG